MKSSNSSVPLIAGAVLLLAILAGTFTLAWHGTIPGGEAIAVAVSVITLVGGAFSVHSGVQAGANAAAAPPSDPTAPVDTTKPPAP